jgi:ribosomal 50S subunit-recycling heat shock protein
MRGNMGRIIKSLHKMNEKLDINVGSREKTAIILEFNNNIEKEKAIRNNYMMKTNNKQLLEAKAFTLKQMLMLSSKCLEAFAYFY